LRVKDRKQLTLAFWSDNVDRLLDFNDRPVLKDNGSVTAKEMKLSRKIGARLSTATAGTLKPRLRTSMI
jgi:hypothetical protein